MYHYGLRGISQKWIQSYLSQRKQFVEYDEVKSSCKDIVCGIPQCSILGPKLFILFTYSIARRRRRLSGRHMYMFSRHRKLDF